MRTIFDYLDAARERQHLRSDRQLAILLGMNAGSIAPLRIGKALPSDDTMVKLARLGGLDEQIALIELNFMRAKDEETRMVYKLLMAKITGTMVFACLSLLMLISSAQAHALQGGNKTTLINQKYTLSHNIAVFWEKLKAFFSHNFYVFFTPCGYDAVNGV